MIHTKFFNRDKRYPIQHCLYAVHSGPYVGQFFFVVEINKKENAVYCLSLPNVENHVIPLKDFIEGIEHNLLRVVTVKLPKDVAKICIKQHQHNIENPNRDSNLTQNEHSNSRLQQSPLQDLLDSANTTE